MPSLAELVDTVIGVDTHRDTPEAETADATGTPIATLKISNDSAGFAAMLAWIAEHAPGPRIVVSMEGTRSYGIGLARALGAVGVMVLECDQPNRTCPQPRHPHHRVDPHAQLSTNPGLRRTAHSEEKSPREIRRCLKRYIARELYRTLTQAMTALTQS